VEEGLQREVVPVLVVLREPVRGADRPHADEFCAVRVGAGSRGTDADAVLARVRRAGVTVVARRRVVGVEAAARTVTGVIGAGVAVVAVVGGGGGTRAALAGVADGAGVGVV